MKVKYGKQKINQLDNPYNYYLPDMGKLVFNKFKTDSSYPNQVFDLNQSDMSYAKYSKVKKALNSLLYEAGRKYPDNEIIFQSNKGKEYASLTDTVQKVFKFGSKKMGVNLIRHSFLTWWLGNNNPSLNQREEVARIMSHSVTTQLAYSKHKSTVVHFD